MYTERYLLWRESVKEIRSLRGRLDLKHLIYLIDFIVLPSLVQYVFCGAACLDLLRSTIVKTMFYSYAVGTGCFVGFDSDFNKFK